MTSLVQHGLTAPQTDTSSMEGSQSSSRSRRRLPPRRAAGRRRVAGDDTSSQSSSSELILACPPQHDIVTVEPSKPEEPARLIPAQSSDTPVRGRPTTPLAIQFTLNHSLPPPISRMSSPDAQRHA